eukprot:Skav217414  [mRNA]  locus=scaffold2674:373608:381455:- [translate_table: standard]
MGSILSVCGNVSTALVLLSSDVLCSLVQTTSNCLVDVVDTMCGSGKNTSRKKIAWHEQRYSNAPIYSGDKPPGTSLGDLDVEKTMAQSKFPIAPKDLIQRAKEVDPLEPNRVWFFSRATGTHTGPLGPIPATGTTLPAWLKGKRIEMPPQAQSMLFNESLGLGMVADRCGEPGGTNACGPSKEPIAIVETTWIGMELLLRCGLMVKDVLSQEVLI